MKPASTPPVALLWSTLSQYPWTPFILLAKEVSRQVGFRNVILKLIEMSAYIYAYCTQNMQILRSTSPTIGLLSPWGWNLAAVPTSINSLSELIKTGQEEQASTHGSTPWRRPVQVFYVRFGLYMAKLVEKSSNHNWVKIAT